MTVPSGINETELRALPDRLHKLLNNLKTTLTDQSDSSKAQRMALYAFAVRVASAAIAYFSQALLARWLGSYEYGIFVFVWVWILVIGALSSIGLNTSVIRFLPQYEESGKTELVRGLMFTSRWVSIAISTAVALIGMALLHFFADAVTNPYVLPGFLILICLPLYTLMDVQDGLARAYSWMDLALVPLYIVRPLLLIAIICTAFWAGFEMTAVTAAASAIAATWIAGIAQLILFNRRFSKRTKVGRKEFKVGFWVKASLPIVLIESFEQLLQHTDILVLSHYVSPSEVAIYFAAAKTIALISFIRFAVSAGFSNKFSTYHANGEHEKLEAFVHQAVNWSFWPSLAGSVVLLAVGKPLLWLFGPEFMAGYPVMFVLVIGLLVSAATGPAEFVLNMLGEQKLCALVLTITTVLNISLNFLFIPSYGALGAASATAISLTLSSVMFVIAAQRRLGLHIFIFPRPGHKKQSDGQLGGKS